MKKGFTLIELLAVIVILAIIAIIATPIVINIIDDTKRQASLRSADFYVDAVEQSVARKKMDGKFNPNVCKILEDGNLLCDETTELQVEVKGETPTEGFITFDNGTISGATLVLNNKTIIKNSDGDYIESYSKGTLAYDILFNYNGAGAIKKLDSNNFAEKLGTEINGLYSALDDLGTSYYYRGDVTNNYVKFGSYEAGTRVNGVTYDVETPIYWRIVRINGDGTIRMMYDGTELVENGVSHNAVVGSEKKSQLEYILNNWYSNNIEGKFDSSIIESNFCIDTKSKCEYDSYNAPGGKYSSWDTRCIYFAYSRIQSNTPKLTCDVDNKLLLVGTLNADEVKYIGSSYLVSSVTWWTFTPSSSWDRGVNSTFKENYSNYDLYNYVVNQYGDLTEKSVRSYYYNLLFPEEYRDYYDVAGVRPVINLKADVKFTGTGKIDNPYVIVID